MKKTVLHTTLASILALTATMIMAAGPKKKLSAVINTLIAVETDTYRAGKPC